MNRIALRLSIGLLVAAVILWAVMQWLAHGELTSAVGDRALQERLLAVSKLPRAERERALPEIARSFDARVEVVRARDLRRAVGPAHPVPTRGGPGMGAGRAAAGSVPHLVGPGPGRPAGRGAEQDVLLVRIPESDEFIRVGPLQKPVWPLVGVAFAVLAIVATMGTLLARPLVRRLTRLQETALRIARGDLHARADASGNDAISLYATHFNQMADRNQALLEGQRDLLRGVSHELRTPVARIRFALELARDAHASSERERHLATIDEDLSEIDELIQELLLVDRLSDGSVLPTTQTFGVLSVVRDEVERQQLKRPQIELSLQDMLDGETELAVMGSERLFRRVVRNLVSNALRHAKTQVRISITRVSAAAIVRIDDDGPGIPASERAHVLEPFVRLDESRSRELGGVGLGLTIVDRILRSVGGGLHIGEASSGGASLVMSWPCGAALESDEP